MSSVATRRHRLSFWTVITLAALAVFVLFLVYPLARMVIISFQDQESASLWQIYADIFTKKHYYQALINSLILAAGATAAATVLGSVLAYLVYRFNVPGKLMVRAAVVVTFVSPPFIGAYAWILLFGNSGFATTALRHIGIDLPSIYGWPGTILVLTLQGMPFVFLMVSSALKSVDQGIEDASVNLGRSPLRTVFTAIAPLILPGLSTGALLVFVTSFSDFGTPAIIGQNLPVFPRLIYSTFVSEFGGDFALASALSVVLLVVTLGALVLQRSFARRRSYGQETVRPLAVRQLRGWRRTLASAVVYLIILAACLPLLTVVVSSFLKTSGSVLTSELTLESYTKTPRLLSTLTNTVWLTTAATLACVVVGCLIGYVIARRRDPLARAIDFFSMVPYAVAGVVFGIALSLAFGGKPFLLAGTPAILIIAYFIRRLPYSIRSVAGMLGQMGRQPEEASVNLGVPPGKTFLRITVPMMAPAVISGALLTWATVVREFNATVILYGVRTKTMSVEVFKQVLDGNFGTASALGTVLILVSLVPIVILFRVLGKDEDFLV